MNILLPVPLLGVGTVDIESFSSYFIRISAIHGRSPDQFWRLLRNLVGDSDDTAVFPNYGSKASRVASLVNPNSTTEELVALLGKSSNLVGLRASTLLSFRSFRLRFRGLKHQYLRWCPRCMAEWQACGETAYFKLCWMLADLPYCHHHSVRLVDTCAKCGGRQTGLNKPKSLLFCEHCNASLALAGSNSDYVSIKEKTAGDMVQLIEHIAMHPDVEFISNGVQKILEKLDEQAERSDEARAVFNALNPLYGNHLKANHDTLTFTQHRAFAAISGISLPEVLRGNCLLETRVLSYDWGIGTKNQWRITPRRRRDFESIKHGLTKFLKDTMGSYPSLRSVANRLDVSVGYIRYRFPVLTRRIIKDHQTYIKRLREEKRRLARRAAVRYFADPNVDDRLKSRKGALKELRNSTSLSKGTLISEIQSVWEARQFHSGSRKAGTALAIRKKNTKPRRN